jgi:hypothetical protein
VRVHGIETFNVLRGGDDTWAAPKEEAAMSIWI